MRVPLIAVAVVALLQKSVAQQTCTSGDVVFADSSDQTYFHKCLAAGVSIRLKCPPGQYFSVSTCVTGVAPAPSNPTVLNPAVNPSPSAVTAPTAPTSAPSIPTAPTHQAPTSGDEPAKPVTSAPSATNKTLPVANTSKPGPGVSVVPSRSPSGGGKSSPSGGPGTPPPTPATKRGPKTTKRQRTTPATKTNISKRKTTPAGKNPKNRKTTIAPKQRKV